MIAVQSAPGDGALAPTRSRSRVRQQSTKWSIDDDALLSRLVAESSDWAHISSHFPGRTSKQVLAHWRKVADPNIVRGSWTAQEDQIILQWVGMHGATKWSSLSDHLPGRIAKQCRERWCNHLDPDIRRTQWSPEEDRVILSLMQQIGNKWAEIARRLSGRSDNAVKNRWNSTLKRRGVPLVDGRQPIYTNLDQPLLSLQGMEQIQSVVHPSQDMGLPPVRPDER